MGHKTHPLGFRLGITQKHRSAWHAKLNEYAKLIQEDYKIRKIIEKLFQATKPGRGPGLKPALPKEASGITKIFIHRTHSKFPSKFPIQILVHTARPGALVGIEGANLQVMDQELMQLLPTQRARITIEELKKTYEHADLIAFHLVDELEGRLPFRRVIKGSLQAAQEAKVQGIKIQISGRLNGAEIARTEWLREGRVPLQTLRADIDYSAKIAQTTHGILGVKVWLFKGNLAKAKG